MSIVSMSTEYALLAMCHLTLQQESGKMTRKTGLTVSHLRSAGIRRFYPNVAANRANRHHPVHADTRAVICWRAPEKITMLNVVEAVEGTMRFNSVPAVRKIAWCLFAVRSTVCG